MVYKVRFTTNQGGFYFPRMRFEERGAAEEWAAKQLEDSAKLDSYEVMECPEFEDLQHDKESDVKTLALTALCLAVLAISFINIIGG